MALSVGHIWEIQTGGSDTLNGGGFDISKTAGMFTDGAATVANTAAPVFTSASYNFVAGDVGAWVYIASGTNWTPGWYKIASVASNAATLNATIGAANLKPAASCAPVPTTVIGCATTASPTSATWSIDYSQQAAAQFAYTDLTAAGAGLTVSSAAKPFAAQQVGNTIVITGGTNFTAGRYVIASVAAAVATVVGAANITTGAGSADGTGGLGGALASPGGAGVHGLASQIYCIKTGTYTITSATQNIAAGCFKPLGGANGTFTWTEGYGSIRGDRGTRPTLILNTGVSTTKIIDLNSGTYQRLINIIVDGHSETSSQGISALGASVACYVENCKAQNCTNSGFSMAGGLTIKCEATGCSTQPAIVGAAGSFAGIFYGCESHGNTVTGFSAPSIILLSCISYANTGASSDGFYGGATRLSTFNCVAYNNGRDGFRSNTGNSYALINCIAEANAGVGFGSDSTAGFNPLLINCAGYNNTGGNYTAANYGNGQVFGFITLTATPFTSASGGDFSLNNTSGGGALVRAVGYPALFPAGTTASYPDVGAAFAAAIVATVTSLATGLAQAYHQFRGGRIFG